MRPCELYLVRHAIAAARGDEWRDDAMRPLTERGVSRFREVVDGLLWMGVGLDEIFTSPLVRARQTADLLAAGFEKPPRVVPIDELGPGSEPAATRRQLARLSKARRVAVVGHEPHLGELAAYLLGSPRALPFKKGGACRIDLDGLAGSRVGALAWFMEPKALRKLGR